MPDYLVEVYSQRRAVEELAQIARRARDAAQELTSAGTAVQYLGAIAIVADEMCLHLYSGPSAAAVADAAGRAAIPVERIVETVTVGGDGSEGRGFAAKGVAHEQFD